MLSALKRAETSARYRANSSQQAHTAKFGVARCGSAWRGEKRSRFVPRISSNFGARLSKHVPRPYEDTTRIPLSRCDESTIRWPPSTSRWCLLHLPAHYRHLRSLFARLKGEESKKNIGAGNVTKWRIRRNRDLRFVPSRGQRILAGAGRETEPAGKVELVPKEIRAEAGSNQHCS